MSHPKNPSIPSRAGPTPETDSWQAAVEKYQRPHRGRAWWQILNSVFGYALVWYLMYLCLSVSWWLIPPLAVLAGGLLVRIFIIFHDCGHGSFFRSPRANAVCGFVCGVLTFTPYRHWRWQHALHHATSGNLDKRGVGDIWTMTVLEYLQSSRWSRFAYRLGRNPAVLFGVAPLYLFFYRQRFAAPNAPRRERRSVWWTNLSLLAMAAGMSVAFGIVPYLLIQAAIVGLVGAAGLWLFYVQHQFDGTYWERSGDWSYAEAALKGSSFYRLPRVLQWFSGNIGFHHIHHLSPRVPNYHLQRCHESDPLFRGVKPVTLRSGFKALSYRLWDESAKKLVGFRHLRSRTVLPGHGESLTAP